MLTDSHKCVHRQRELHDHLPLLGDTGDDAILVHYVDHFLYVKEHPLLTFLVALNKTLRRKQQITAVVYLDHLISLR